ncbi:MAG: dihydrodipicolinate synthase family protein [Firmicutes bacterium]|nr:dihydrodipicolinate synthase family protein [Bacillota bacterium]
MATATRIHLDLFPIFKGLFITTNPIPVKTAMNMMGHEVGGLRPPLPAASEAEQAAIRSLLKSYNKL